MKCTSCDLSSVLENPRLCKKHFINYFEKKVSSTIASHQLLNKKQNIAVAVSGGKDSLALLYVLHTLGFQVSAIAIDEGIAGYRDSSLNTMKQVCNRYSIPYKIYSFKQEIGMELDTILDKTAHRPCTVCGVFRRYLLNIAAKEYDVIATGHNQDDEAQAVLMNLLKGNITLLYRQGPRSGAQEVQGLVPRVKPLFNCAEKEIMTYAFLQGLTTRFNECPNVVYAFRLQVRDALNEYALNNENAKNMLLKWLLSLDHNTKKMPQQYCKQCNAPASTTLCKACLFKSQLIQVKN